MLIQPHAKSKGAGYLDAEEKHPTTVLGIGALGQRVVLEAVQRIISCAPHTSGPAKDYARHKKPRERFKVACRFLKELDDSMELSSSSVRIILTDTMLSIEHNCSESMGKVYMSKSSADKRRAKLEGALRGVRWKHETVARCLQRAVWAHDESVGHPKSPVRLQPIGKMMVKEYLEARYGDVRAQSSPWSYRKHKQDRKGEPILGQFEVGKHGEPILEKRQFRYDFVIWHKGKPVLIIEVDGRQHHKSVAFFGGEAQLKKTKASDELKNEAAARNGVNLVRLDQERIWKRDKLYDWEGIIEEAGGIVD